MKHACACTSSGFKGRQLSQVRLPAGSASEAASCRRLNHPHLAVIVHSGSLWTWAYGLISTAHSRWLVIKENIGCVKYWTWSDMSTNGWSMKSYTVKKKEKVDFSSVILHLKSKTMFMFTLFNASVSDFIYFIVFLLHWRHWYVWHVVLSAAFTVLASFSSLFLCSKWAMWCLGAGGGDQTGAKRRVNTGLKCEMS